MSALRPERTDSQSAVGAQDPDPDDSFSLTHLADWSRESTMSENKARGEAPRSEAEPNSFPTEGNLGSESTRDSAIESARVSTAGQPPEAGSVRVA